MSNFSNIGFNLDTEDDFYDLVNKAYDASKRIDVRKGAYHLYSDPSGAELWIQLNRAGQVIGANPHFKGTSKRTIGITESSNRPESILDGSFHAWANPGEYGDDFEDGDYPFLVDIPDHKTIEDIVIPQKVDFQLSAFAHELSYYSSEEEYDASQTEDPKFAVHSFVPTGLFNFEDGQDQNPPEAYCMFTGVIKSAEKRTNQLTGDSFFCMLVETLGGEVDVVADPRFFENQPPEKDGIVQGTFWLSGRVISKPEMKERKSFLSKLFGK